MRWALAISTLALAFPATALGAQNGAQNGGQPAAVGASGEPSHKAGVGHAVLGFGSGYSSAAGSPLVRALQRQLELAGYSPGGIDGIFGSRTRQAVLAFQTSHGLAADGIVGPHTWAALDAPALILGPGAEDQPGGSSAVRSLQRRLAFAGDPPGPIDGRFGVLTEGAVRRFQRTHSLQATGMAGPQTLALLSKPAGSVRGLTPPARKPARPAPLSHPLPQRPATSVPRSSIGSRPPTSKSSPAPRQHPATAIGKAPQGTGHRPSSLSVPWWIVLGALALILAAPLLITGWRYARRRDDDETSVATTSNSETNPAAPKQTVFTAANGEDKAVGWNKRNQTHSNGHRAEANGAHGGNGAKPRPSGKQEADFPESAEAADAFNLGLLLEGQGGTVEAQAAYGRADERGHGTAASNLGRLLEEQGALAEAEAAYRRADERGDAEGAFNLGRLLDGQGGVVEAQAAYGRADERGHGTAASNLGRLLEEQGALAEAEAAYRRADKRGDGAGAFHLGVLLEDRGALDEAADAYSRASDRGDDVAACCLGILLGERGALAEAETAFRRADERGDAVAAFNLGVVLEARGALNDAEAAYRRADERGDAAGAFNLGLLLEGHGGMVEAQAAYGRADQRGHGTAASNLGRLLEEQGALAEAEAAYRRADERGDGAGAFHVGVLLEARGARDEAVGAYSRASDRGHNAAASYLGVLLEEQGARAEAEAAFRRADERGDAVAAFNLGVVLEAGGALTDAEDAYRRAEERGEGDIAKMARTALLDLDGALQETGAVRAGRAR